MLERVYTWVDYYDKPLSGAAEFDGEPHWYRCSFDENIDDYSNEYRLTPIARELLSAEVERQEIFLEWHTAFKAGQVDRTSHPALPKRRARHDELTKVIERFLEQANFSIRAAARWVQEDGQMRVEWIKIRAD